MLYSFIAYIKFLFNATNQHGVHSPFVYDLVTKCFYDKTKYNHYADLKAYREALLKNDNMMSITDLGSGSKKNYSKKRQVSQIAKTSGTPLKRAKLLYRVTRYFKSNSLLELGTSLGMATYAMHLGNPNANIITIEGCPNCSNFSKNQLQDPKQLTFLTGDFKNHIPNLVSKSFDTIFFDGNHNKDATLLYFESLLATAHNTSVFIFDDIYWSKGMTEAWEAIKQHPQVTVTIDTYFWGFVFFRKEQSKQHFKIRL